MADAASASANANEPACELAPPTKAAAIAGTPRGTMTRAAVSVTTLAAAIATTPATQTAPPPQDATASTASERPDVDCSTASPPTIRTPTQHARNAHGNNRSAARGEDTPSVCRDRG